MKKERIVGKRTGCEIDKDGHAAYAAYDDDYAVYVEMRERILNYGISLLKGYKTKGKAV